MPSFLTPSRRQFLATGLAGLGAAGLLPFAAAAQKDTRNTDVVRLTWGFHGLTLIAKERGVFEKTLADQGIKVEWLGPFPNHAPTLQAVTGGSADFGFGGSTTPAFAAILAGSPLVFSQFVLYEPRTTAINTVPDLIGKSVAVNRSGLGEFLLVAALEKHGIDSSKVKFVYLNPPDAAPALASGKVDAWSMWSPGVDIARLEYKAHDVFLEGRDLDFFIDYSSYVTSRKFATENSQIVKAVANAYEAEAKWTNANVVEAETIVQKRAGYSEIIRDQFIERKRHYTLIPVTDKAFVAQLQTAADWLAARKILPEKIIVADHLAQY
ncbi:NrtA/SsuA/CpmA family ABC transporter substrate-binding protein [Xanthobacter autotrophicus]|uniref:NrtA/SsuA/CpmA family ABC transporter substrate-binding protein n=1 Tax=Xanthobacter autotrophicus TaxID=280 RepID=UPI00372789BD